MCSDKKKEIIDNLIEDYINKPFDIISAEITYYDDVLNKASIKFKNPKDESILNMDNVTVDIGGGGVHCAAPNLGQEVLVAFINKSPLKAKIIAVAQENYKDITSEKLKHIRQGSFLPDNIYDRITYSESFSSDSIEPMVEDWIDYKNKNNSKYAAFTDINPCEMLSNNYEELGYYKKEEVGLTHPLSLSSVKLRNNGSIDIFVDNNEGIRIDPNTRTINTIGTFEKHHVSDFLVFSDRKVKLYSNEDIDMTSQNNMSITTNGTWKINVVGEVNINSNSNINLNARKSININSKSFTVNGNELMDILKKGE